jgi:hypothetical protein
MTTTITDIAAPYIYINGRVQGVWFIYPAADEADEIEVDLDYLPVEQANAVLTYGFPVVIEGVNDDDTLGV